MCVLVSDVSRLSLNLDLSYLRLHLSTHPSSHLFVFCVLSVRSLLQFCFWRSFASLGPVFVEKLVNFPLVFSVLEDIQSREMAYSYGFSSSSSSSNDGQVPLFCPKPRRVGQLMGVESIRPHSAFHQDVDVFDLFLTKDAYDLMDRQWEEDDSEMSSSPPFFCGSPPSRATNPLIRDALFLQEKSVDNNTPLALTTTLLPFLPSSPQPITPTATAGKRRGATFFHSTTNFGSMPAAVRIEGGFDCLDRNNNRNSCSSRISAFA